MNKINISTKVDTNLQNMYENIKGKKVFIFDLETTGLFDKKMFYKYWDNYVFNTARIVEIAYYYSDNFDTEDNFTTNNLIHSYLRKPTDFNIIDPVAEITHGISIEKLKTDGYKFSQILNADLLSKLCNTEYIISHNTQFDFYILLNELNRFKLKNTISSLLNIKNEKKLLCTCKKSGYMTLTKLYNGIFNLEPTIIHRAGDDVNTLVEIITRKKLTLIYKTDL